MKIFSHNSQSRQAFSLVEILVSVLIMVVLMSMVFGGFNYFKAKQTEEAARITVNRLNMHLEDYKSHTGSMPDPGNNLLLSSNALYRALFGDFNNIGVPDESAVIYYEELDPELSEGAKGNRLVEKRDGLYLILDPWGQPIRYRLGFNNGNKDGQNPDFDIWSVGPDGRSGTEDDITNGFNPVY